MTAILSKPSDITPSPLPIIAFCAALGIASPTVKGAVTLLFPNFPSFVFSYLVIFLVVLAMALLSVRNVEIFRDSVVRFSALWVGMITIHYFVINNDSVLVQFKALLQYKLLLGVGTAVLLYLMVRQLIIGERTNVLRRVMGAYFAFLFVLNMTVIIIGTLGLLPVADVQILENNRAAFELFVIGFVWTMLDDSGSSISWMRLDTQRKAAVIAIILVAMAYSTRSIQIAVMVWVIVLILRSPLIVRASHRLILPAGILLVLGTATIYPASNVVRGLMLKAGTPQIAKAMDNNYRTIDLYKNRIPSFNTSFMQFFFPETFKGQSTLVIPKSGISSISRIVHMGVAVNSLIESPTGQGYVLDRNKILGHSNHSLFFILLQSYGVFWVFFLIITFFGGRRQFSDWFLLLPLVVNMLFMPNVMATALLALSVRSKVV